MMTLCSRRLRYNAVRDLVFREPEEEARLPTRHGQRDSHAMQPPNKWPPYLAHTRVADEQELEKIIVTVRHGQEETVGHSLQVFSLRCTYLPTTWNPAPVPDETGEEG